VVTIQPPANCSALHPHLNQPQLPPRERLPTQHVAALAQLLAGKTALNLPPPAVPAALLRCPTWGALQAKITSWTGADDDPLLRFLVAIDCHDFTADIDDQEPLPELPADLLVPSWAHLLGPSTRSLQFNPTTKQHTIVLSTPNHIVCVLLTHHLQRYIRLQQRFASAPVGALGLDQLVSARERRWLQEIRKTGAGRITLRVSEYGIQYQAHRVRGFHSGPQGAVNPGQYVNWEQLYGHNGRLLDFLRARAPHCVPELSVSSSGYTSRVITFYHEPQYLTELYALHGATSPTHGILRPLNLHGNIEQYKAATASCCTFCWHAGHTRHACSHRAPDEEEVRDPDTPPSSLPLHASRACKQCYSFDHSEAHCTVAPAARTCRLCNQTGHSSADCASFSPSWVPLTLPMTPAGKDGQHKPLRPSPIITQHTVWAANYRSEPLPQRPVPPPFQPPDFPPLPSTLTAPQPLPPTPPSLPSPTQTSSPLSSLSSSRSSFPGAGAQPNPVAATEDKRIDALMAATTALQEQNRDMLKVIVGLQQESMDARNKVDQLAQLMSQQHYMLQVLMMQLPATAQQAPPPPSSTVNISAPTGTFINSQVHTQQTMSPEASTARTASAPTPSRGSEPPSQQSAAQNADINTPPHHNRPAQ
jgi:hypothetical protein